MQHSPAGGLFLPGNARVDAFCIRGLRVLLVCCCFFLVGCLETKLPDGVMATVNGTPITLRSLQALLDSHSASLGTRRSPSLENMKREYGEALGTLIIYELVRQELQQRQMSVSDAALDAAINDVRKDYGGGDNGDDGLEQYLTEKSIDPVEWRALMRGHLSVVSFEKRVLIPEVKISLAEVRAYYSAHEKDFRLPETLHVCLVSGESRQDVKEFCTAFAARPTPNDAAVKLQCLRTSISDLPQDWRKSAESLKGGQCAPVRQENGAWRSLALIERHAARNMSLSEAYPLVEAVLREQKMPVVFEAWLAEALGRASIAVIHDLVPDLLTPPSTRPAVSDDGTTGPGQGDSSPLLLMDEPYQGDTPDFEEQRSDIPTDAGKGKLPGNTRKTGHGNSGDGNSRGRNDERRQYDSVAPRK